MKITVSPTDVRQIREALSRLAAAQQWIDILTEVGIDMSEELDRVSANRKILEGLVARVEPLVGGLV